MTKFKISAHYHQAIVDKSDGYMVAVVCEGINPSWVLDCLNAEPAPDLSDIKAKHSALIGALDATLDDTTMVDPVRHAAWALLNSLNQVYGRQPSKAPPVMEIGDKSLGDILGEALKDRGRVNSIDSTLIGVPFDSDLGRKLRADTLGSAVEYGHVLKLPLLERIEAFLADVPGTDAQDASTALLRDLRAVMGKLKPYTVISYFPGDINDYGKHEVHRIDALNALEAWELVQLANPKHQHVAVFPGHLVEE